jgi:cellulase
MIECYAVTQVFVYHTNVDTGWLEHYCGKRSCTVSSDLAPGNYLIRAEAIALHAASSVGGA